jgi:hypothetical protein
MRGLVWNCIYILNLSGLLRCEHAWFGFELPMYLNLSGLLQCALAWFGLELSIYLNLSGLLRCVHRGLVWNCLCT